MISETNGETQDAQKQVARTPTLSAETESISTSEFAAAFGEDLSQTLDLDTWDAGGQLAAVFDRLDKEVAEALDREDTIRKAVREVVFPTITARSNAPGEAGVFQATTQELKSTQANILFNGGTEGCDGTCAVHDTLPLTIAQIGVCLVSYLGEHGSWVQRLFRRDLRVRGLDPVEEAVAVLERRAARAGFGQPSARDKLTELGRRGIMTYAERAVLLRKSKAPWRMGHGNPAPYEILTGSGSMDLLKAGLDVVEELVVTHRRFVFIPSAPGERMLLTIGNALRPLEYAVVDDSKQRIERIIEQGHLRGPHRKRAEDFCRATSSEILIGVYRTSSDVPCQIFYAHKDFVHEAALIAMADSIIQSHRGFPMLIDLADSVCRSTFGIEAFNSTVQSAYARRGKALPFLGERQTRA